MKLSHHPFSRWNTEHEMEIVREPTPNQELPANKIEPSVCVCAKIKNKELEGTLVSVLEES